MQATKTAMDITGIIVEVHDGRADSLLRAFSCMPDVRLYGLRDNRIVLMMVTDDTHALTQRVQEIEEMEGVTGVYPVFSRESLPF